MKRKKFTIIENASFSIRVLNNERWSVNVSRIDWSLYAVNIHSIHLIKQ